MEKPKDIKVKCGSDFLPDITTSYLKKLHKKETNPRARDRLLAYMQRKDGLSTQRIATNLGRVKSTIFKWLYRVQEEGLSAIYERKGRGKKHLLDEDQRKQLIADLDAGPEKCGFEASLWNATLVRRHIFEKFGVQYSLSGTQSLLPTLGFSWRKARPKNPKAASKEQQDEFKKSAGARTHNVKGGVRNNGWRRGRS